MSELAIVSFIDARLAQTREDVRALDFAEPALVAIMLNAQLAHERILARHRDCGSGHGYCDDGGHGGGETGCAELEDLAAHWAHDPGYEPSWKSW